MDRISELPDNVLVHILSFLPTVYAVRTSKLARRWRHLWKSVHNLDFDVNGIKNIFFPHRNDEESETKRLMKDKVIEFVDRVLLSHDRLNIENFSLSFSQELPLRLTGDDLSVINSWVSAAVSRNARVISLSMVPYVPYVPPCLFTCDTLCSLHLDMRSNVLKFPSTVHFAKLKTLHIISATFSDEFSTSQLLSSSPVLENLHILKCLQGESTDEVLISSLTLKRLELHLAFGTYNLTLHTPKLECFRLKHYVKGFLTCDQLPCIIEATFDNCYCASVTKMLKSMHMCAYLSLCDSSSRHLASNFKETATSPFCQLKELRIAMGRKKQNLELVIHLINTNPELNKLIVVLPLCIYGNPTDLLDYQMLSSSLLKNLRNIEVTSCREPDIDFLKYLLATQSSLETMTIKCYEKDLERVSKELIHCLKLSNSVY